MAHKDNYWERAWRTRLTRRRLLKGAAVGGAGLAAAAVIGCDEEEAGAPAVQQPGPAGAGEQAVVRGGTQTWANESTEAQPHLDVHKNTFGPLQDSGAGIAYNRLLMFDIEKYPEGMVPTGDLAESWEIPDASTVVFKLRRGVKFQNVTPVNGREFVAGDVVYSFQRILAEKVSAPLITAVDTFEAPDNYTVRMKLKKPDADFIFNMADVKGKIVPKEAVDVNGNLEKGPIIGTGPWIFEEWVPEQILRLKRNPEYFRQGLPYTDSWVRVVIPDANTSQAAFRTGQTLGTRTNGQITRLLKQTVPDLQVHDSKLLQLVTHARLWVSPAREQTKDVRVRQAISKALDRDVFIRDVVFGSGWISAAIFMPSLDWHLSQDELKRLLGRDLTAAKQLISAAGVDVSRWKPILEYGIPNLETTSAAELVGAQLKELGIEATLKVADKVELTEKIYQRGDTELTYGSNTPASPTSTHLFTFYHTTGFQAGLWKHLGDKQLDDMIERQSVILNQEERKNLLKDIQRRVIDLAVAVPVYSPNAEFAVAPRVQGYKHPSGFEPNRFQYVWLRA